jgi:acetyl-CoA acetyltransferase
MGAADTAFQKVDIYGTEDGPAFLLGIQALVRLPMVQRRLDRSQGLDTARLVSGYRGSPLGGYDQQLWKAAAALKAHDIVFQPGLNEDLAATALWGAQMHRAFGPARWMASSASGTARGLASIVHATHAQQPEWFSTAPIGAVAKLFQKTGWKVKDVDLWEVNEAFAVVPMALMHELDVSHEIVNVHGGACALGHPIGTSGARIMVTLIHALKARGKKRGVATLCIGGGEGTAVALELL